MGLEDKVLTRDEVALYMLEKGLIKLSEYIRFIKSDTNDTDDTDEILRIWLEQGTKDAESLVFPDNRDFLESRRINPNLMGEEGKKLFDEAVKKEFEQINKEVNNKQEKGLFEQMNNPEKRKISSEPLTAKLIEEYLMDIFYRKEKPKREVKIMVVFDGATDEEVEANAEKWFKEVWNLLIEKAAKDLLDE